MLYFAMIKGTTSLTYHTMVPLKMAEESASGAKRTSAIAQQKAQILGIFGKGSCGKTVVGKISHENNLVRLMPSKSTSRYHFIPISRGFRLQGKSGPKRGGVNCKGRD